MHLDRVIRLAIDVGMALVFVALMATATVEEVEHEWLGSSMFVLFTTHQVLNRKWWTSLLKGRPSAVQLLGSAATLGLTLCIIGQAASSLVLSEHAFGFLPAFPGAAWARIVHMLCSYWGFVLAFVHAGFHVRSLAKSKGAHALAWPARIVWFAVAVFGVWSFIKLDLGTYLFLRSQFLFVDVSVPLALTAAEYAAVGVLVAGVAHYVRQLLASSQKHAGTGARKPKKTMRIPRGKKRDGYGQEYR